MQYIHVRNLEKYHPGYRDRTLHWAKIYINMVAGDPEIEMIENEIDWARLVKFILLELRAQKPLPNSTVYWVKNGFDLKKRSMSLTLQMLHNFLDIVTEPVDLLTDSLHRVDKIRVEEDKKREDKKREDKIRHLEFVLLSKDEFEKLESEIGAAGLQSMISKLNNYIGSKGVQYKSHYHTILNWASKEVKFNKHKTVEERLGLK